MADAKLKKHLEQMEECWSENTSWPFFGMSSGYKHLDEMGGGFRDGIYLFAGGAGVGKTSFLSNLLFQFMQLNPQAMGLMYSLDQSYLDLVARLFALAADLPVDMIRNPRQIKEREELEKRLQGFEVLNGIKERLTILDQSHDSFSLKDIESQLAPIRDEALNEPIILAVDPVMDLYIPGVRDEKEKSYIIMEELKRLARKYKACVIVSMHTDLAARQNRPTLEEVQSKAGLVYGADLVGLLYNDSLNQFETPFLEWEWGTENLMVPLVELNIVKNKHNRDLGRLFFRFYNAQTRYRECTKAENDHYNEMLKNLDHFDKDPKKRKDALQKKVYVAPKRKEYEGIF
ncbi:MAG: hypothetical protein H3C47_01065 [Candidatus Cloacimonetes bacterium]|nr:hypothetical protein [Candidatus Cloacimonadota bacterium]